MSFLVREKNLSPPSQVLTHKALMMLVIGWLFLSLIQTLHFYWYFEQTLWNSVRWSFRDWFVWFVIFGCLFAFFTRQDRFSKFSARNVLIVAGIAVASGFLQTFIVVSIDFVMGNPSRPFWEDFSRFYSKRWLQHLFVFTIFWLLMINRAFFRTPEAREDVQNIPSTDVQKIQINDGKNTQWIAQKDIYCVEAAGNYMCFHTTQGQLIARGSLKHIEEKLDSTVFMRVSRSNIVNVNKIESTHRVNRSRVELTLSDKQRVTIGPTYWREIKTKLGL